MSTHDQQFNSFAEFWTDGVWAPFVEILHPGENRAHTLAVLEQPDGSYPDPAIPEFNIQLVAKGNPTAKVSYGGTEFASKTSPGSIFIAPSNTDCNYEVDAAHRVVSLAINTDSMTRFREQYELNLPKDFGSLHEKTFFDPIVEALILRMLEQAMMDHPVSDLFLDQATNTILTSLLCRSGSIENTTETPKPLSQPELARVTEAIEGQIEDNLNIADLASVTSLSDWHFARAFKAATGLSPHQYVLRRRIARAKDLLENSNLALAEVAVAAGFSSQSHMTDTFREKVGATPGRYRSKFK